MYIKGIVEKYIKKYKTRDPFELADKLNITVNFLDLDMAIHGLYQYEKRCKFIHINSNLSDEEKRAVCAHEIGHAILHPTCNKCVIMYNTYYILEKFEREANVFAAYLLIKDEILKEYIGIPLHHIASLEGIPIELFEVKASYEKKLASF